MKEREGNCRIRNLIAWFCEKATNLWTLSMHKNLFWTLLFIVYFCFQSFFEKLLTDYLVLPFLSSFEVTFFTRILFAVGVIYIIARTCYALWNKEQISLSHLYIALLLVLIWAYYRFYSDAFTFTYVIDNIAFVDIVALYAVLLYFTWSAVWVITKISSIRNKKTNQGEGFVLDEPIHEDPQEDILKRSPFAESIANKLLRTKLSERSFAIGIVAPWGYGKTSFVNLIKYHLGDRAIIMDYSPWVYGKGSNLTQAFFAELSKKLSCYNRSLNHQIKAYASLLGKTDSTMLQLLSSVYALFYREDSLETAKETLEKTLKSIPKPIVIVVDDLDRLTGEEIMEVLQLMRNGASFPNLYFIAAYDKNYMVKTISEQNKMIMPDIYLEKIFQIEYAIPQFEKDVLQKVLFESCSKFMVNANDVEDLKEAVYDSYGLRGFVMDELRSLRDVKRFVNALHATYPHLKGEIVLKDLMNITLLKIKYKEAFDLLGKYRSRLFKKGIYGSLVLYKRENEQNDPAGLNGFLNRDMIDIREEWDKYFGHVYSEVQKEKILSIFDKLFSDSFMDLRGINSEVAYERYFYDMLLEEDYSADEFDNLWGLPFEEIKRRVKSALSTKSFSLQSQLKKFQPKDKDTYMKWVRTILYVGTNSTKNIFGINDFRKIKILNPPSCFKNGHDTYKTFLQTVLYENGPSWFVCEFLMHLEREVEWPLELFTQEETREIRLNMFNKIASLKDTSFMVVDNYMELMRIIVITACENDLLKEERRYIDGAKNIYKSFSEQHIIPMVTSMIIPLNVFGTKRYGINQRVITIWDSWKNFEDFVNRIKKNQVNHNIDSKELDEFIRFMDECKNRGWETGVEFEFEYLNVEK